MEELPVETMKARLRRDLRTSLAERRKTEVEVLRNLLGALDQAEAVPVAATGYVSRRFGERGAEVARKQLSAEEVAAVLLGERDELDAAAQDYADRGRADAADEIRLKAAVVERYLAAG